MTVHDRALHNKTFDDGAGRHALVYEDGQYQRPNQKDVNHLVAGNPFHPTRLDPNYQPRHAQTSELAAGK